MLLMSLARYRRWPKKNLGRDQRLKVIDSFDSHTSIYYLQAYLIVVFSV